MTRILLQYLGQTVIDSEAKFHYRQMAIGKAMKKRKRPAKEYFFDSILFPYHTVGSLIIGKKEGSRIIEPYFNDEQKIVQTFDLYYDKRYIPTKRKTKLSDKVFVLKDKEGNYALNDPLTDNILLTRELGLLRTWDVYYPLMEDYFKKSHRYHVRFALHYLSKEEIKQLNV